MGFFNYSQHRNFLILQLRCLHTSYGKQIKCFRSYRYASYRQDTWQIHNQLGKGVRKVTTAWTIQAIKNSFSSENEKYTLFIKSNDHEDHTSQSKTNSNYCEFCNCNVFRHQEPLILLQSLKNTVKQCYFQQNY